jgi:hypothetical protein
LPVTLSAGNFSSAEKKKSGGKKNAEEMSLDDW